MIVARLRAASKLDGSNIKLATVNMVLMLMVTVPALPMGGREAHFYISNVTVLLVPSSCEQCKKKASAVNYNHIAGQASQTLKLTECVHVAWEFRKNHVA